MASKFSVWLLETARLYLRYMAVAMVALPFALAYPIAVHAGWDSKAVSVFLSVVGILAAALMWKWLDDWLDEPKVTATPVAALDDSWATLIAAPHGRASKQYSVFIDTHALLALNEALTREMLSGQVIEISLIDAIWATSAQMLASQPADSFTSILTGQRTSPPPIQSFNGRISSLGVSRQMQDAACGLA